MFVSKNSPQRGSYSPPLKINDTGTQIQARAWALANPSVVEYITLMVSMSEHRQGFLDLKLRDRLSVADAIIIHQRLGVTKAANFVDVVDPWCYPDDDTPSTIVVKPYLHSLVDKAASAKISDKTEASITEFLLSPLLMKKGGRPSFVLKAKKQRSTPSERSFVTAAATVVRRPISQLVDLPIIEGRHLQNFRLPSPLPPPHHPISLLSLLIKHSPLLGGLHVND